MKEYAYGRIERLHDSLADYGVDPEIMEEILAGGREINEKTKQERKAEWFREAMIKMDRLLPEGERREIRENCACCLGGKRLELSKQIARKFSSLEDRIAAADNTKFVFGNGVKWEEDGTLTVTFYPDNLESYQCVCLRKAAAPISDTYCYCCAGHIKHHLQIALDRKLSGKVVTSVLSSGGKTGCRFSYTITE